MSNPESLPERDYRAEFIGISESLEGDEESQHSYFREQMAKIMAGEPTWMARNFESEGICFDYYVDKEPIAQLTFGGWDGGGFEIYYGDESSTHSTLQEAVDTIEGRFPEAEVRGS